MNPGMFRDLRYAFRNLRHAPLFVTVALLSLALGIGANTAIFTIADQVLLRPLPVAHAAQLVHFTSPGPQSGMMWGMDCFSYLMYRDLRDHNTSFDGIAGRFPTPLNLTHNNRSERVNAEIVTGTYFNTLGLSTILGRPLTPEDDLLPAAQPVAVLTYDFWRRRFNGNPAILNQTVLLNGYPITVVGIAAPGYHGLDVGERTDLLVPTMMKNQMTPTWQGLDNRRVLWLQLIGSLKPGVSPKQASASLEPYYHGVLIMEMQSIPFRSQESRARFASKPLIFKPASQGISDLRESFQDPLLILFAIVGILLLIACANVANLQLARAVARQREIAVRLAIGAGRWALLSASWSPSRSSFRSPAAPSASSSPGGSPPPSSPAPPTSPSRRPRPARPRLHLGPLHPHRPRCSDSCPRGRPPPPSSPSPSRTRAAASPPIAATFASARRWSSPRSRSRSSC